MEYVRAFEKPSQTSAVFVFVGGKHGDHFSSFHQDKVIISPILIIKLKEVERGHRSSRLWCLMHIGDDEANIRGKQITQPDGNCQHESAEEEVLFCSSNSFIFFFSLCLISSFFSFEMFSSVLSASKGREEVT